MSSRLKEGDWAGVRAEIARLREREAATRSILHIMSRSRDDEGPVFQTILDSAARLCKAPHAFLQLRNDADTHLKVAAQSFATSRFLDLLRANPIPLHNNPGSISVRGMTADTPTQYEDIRCLKGTELYTPQLGYAMDAEGMRTALFVPLHADDRPIGVFCLYKHEVAPFSDEEVRLVQTFAAQALIAIENVRQFREVQSRLEREAATSEVLRVISRSRDDEQPVFEAIHRNVSRLCNAPFSGLFLVNETGDYLELVSLLGGSPQYAGSTPRKWSLSDISAVARAVIKREVIHVADLRETDAYRKGHDFTVQAVDVEGIRTFLAVPLMKDEAAVGSIGVYRNEPRPFSTDEIELVKTFCAQAVIAIEAVRQFKALESLNTELEQRVEDQVGEIERMGRLKRFLPAAVANAVVSSGNDQMLASHRALLGVLFCDIRGFTAFCETAEPEETIEVLQTYHEEMGKLIEIHGAGVDHRMGDGIMVLFNDPLPCADPAGSAVRLAVAMRARMAELCQNWKRLGHRLGFGVGVSLGYATVGMVGSEGRFDYTASGTAINLAARLCEEAADGEILLSPRARIAVEANFAVESQGGINLKGIREPVEVFRLSDIVPS